MIDRLSTLGQAVVAIGAGLVILGVHACGASTPGIVQNTTLTVSDASRLYQCVTGNYGKSLPEVIATCGPEEADLIRDVFVDIAAFADKRAAAVTCTPPPAKDAGK